MKVVKVIFLNLCLVLVFLCDNACTKHDDPKKTLIVDSCFHDTCQHVKKCGVDKSTPAITILSSNLQSHLDNIQLPPGFKIEIFAEVPNARQLAVSPSGIVYVGNNNAGQGDTPINPDYNKVYALQDVDGDYKADKKWVVASGLTLPNGVAFKDGDLYIGEKDRIIKLPKIEECLDSPSAPIVIIEYPKPTKHVSRYIAFGPDGKLYVPAGAPCDACESSDSIFGTITRITADGSSGIEIYAKGVRNPVGMAWHPVSNELWFTDPGRDMLGPDEPDCELNNAPQAKMNFGFPYCHGGSVPDPALGTIHPCSDFTPPAEKMGPHITPLGLKFYTGAMFPATYKNQLFVAQHGSWSRTPEPLNGHNIVLVKINDKNKSEGFETFASGWLTKPMAANSGEGSWGRPVDILILKDGSMLVSDDKAGVVYRISYK